MSRSRRTSRSTAVVTAVLAVGVTLALGAAPASAVTTKSGASLSGASLNGASLNGASLNGASLN